MVGFPFVTSGSAARSGFRVPHWGWLLLVSVVLFANVAGLRFGVPLYQQQVAIRMIEQAGGAVRTRHGGPAWLRSWVGDDWMKPLDHVQLINLSRTGATDADLAKWARLERFESLETLIVSDTQITDAGLVSLKRFSALKYLQLADLQVTDGGLAHVGELESLEALQLIGLPISDAGVPYLCRLTRLKSLSLYRTPLTDAGVNKLPPLSSLVELYLPGSHITAAGLQCIDVLPGLHELFLNGANVAEGRIDDLAQEHPALRVYQ